MGVFLTSTTDVVPAEDGPDAMRGAWMCCYGYKRSLSRRASQETH